MRAAVYTEFNGSLNITDVPMPQTPPDGVVIEVKATGLCRSDWHGWKGHDPDIKLPHVPGHEFAGIIFEVGPDVNNWNVGDRVTVPFVCGCGKCDQCASGNQQICDNQSQPGFTHWGSFAEYVAIYHADENLVRIPEHLTFSSAATLGCRFITSFRSIVDQGKVKSDEWVAIHGCGGVGLSAIMIASAMGAHVIAVDIQDEKLAFANKLGATHIIHAGQQNVAESILKLCGGAHISVDALGSKETCVQSLRSLRKHGRHIQVGLMFGTHHDPPIPMDLVIANELVIKGSHGMQAHRYPQIFEMIEKGQLRPDLLVKNQVSLNEASKLLTKMDQFQEVGVTIITEF